MIQWFMYKHEPLTELNLAVLLNLPNCLINFHDKFLTIQYNDGNLVNVCITT